MPELEEDDVGEDEAVIQVASRIGGGSLELGLTLPLFLGLDALQDELRDYFVGELGGRLSLEGGTIPLMRK